MTLTQEVSSCKATFLQDEDEAISLGRSLEDHEFLAAFAGQNPPSAIAAPPSPRRNKNLRQTKLLHRFETVDDHETTDDGIAEINDSLDENLMELTEQASKLNWNRPVLTEVVTAGRKRLLLAQNEAVTGKPECEKRKMPGSIFTKKQGKSWPRQSLKDFFGGCLTQVLKNGSKLFAKISEVNAATAETFKFDMEDYYSPEFCSFNIEGVALADGATLIFNEHCQAGLGELKAAFLCQPGVSPELVPNRWLENAYKWIVVKLAALELWSTSRGGTLTHCLNPETVLLQLKYRYDREIDLVQRPAIRKILEKDDSPAKPMVLFVAQVFDMDIELSDGWYGIRTQLDTPLRHFIKSGRIKVGTKLVVQNAELVGADDTGCSPLDVPAHVRLSIFANSTRVARWDTKLGYCPRPRPLRIPLDSVLENGGVISEAVGCILRVYPMMYVDKSTKTSTGSSGEQKKFEIFRTYFKIFRFFHSPTFGKGPTTSQPTSGCQSTGHH
jgi:breast cancer 2 susceptibility protein